MKKKLLYMCSFVPYKTLEAAGFQMISAYDIELGLKHSINNTKLSGNLCSFIKYCERIDYSEYDGVIFTNCCNSAQRLYDYVKFSYLNIFTYILDIPGNNQLLKVDNQPEKVMTIDLINKLNCYFNVTISYNNIFKPEAQLVTQNHIWVISSAIHKKYMWELSSIFSNYNLKFDVCSSECRGDRLLSDEDSEISCLRMKNFYNWFEKKLNFVKGIIYIIAQRCDHAMFSYPEIKKICDKHRYKILLVEEEFTSKISERSKIRYEAFKECLTEL